MTLPAEVAALIGKGEVARRVANVIATTPGLSYAEVAQKAGTTERSVQETVRAMNNKLWKTGYVFQGDRYKGAALFLDGEPIVATRRRLTCIPPDMRPKRRRLTATPPKGWKPNPVPAGNPGSSHPQLGRGLSAAPAFSGGQK